MPSAEYVFPSNFICFRPELSVSDPRLHLMTSVKERCFSTRWAVEGAVANDMVGHLLRSPSLTGRAGARPHSLQKS